MRQYYENPLIERYASKEILKIFSPDNKFKTWRKLWTALAESEKELGLPITNEQIQELKEHIEDIDYDRVKEKEKELRHDVMAHVHVYGEQCPKAKSIIHLGATSAFVGDNTDIIIYTQGLKFIRKKLINVIDVLTNFALQYKDLPTLGFTHFQPAQLTTVGKRACLWIQDLLIDLENIEFQLSKVRLRGAKGTTGTQASFLKLFDGDHEKVKKLDQLISKKMGFDHSYKVTGQTYTRKWDSIILSLLSGIAQSLHKFSNDIRLLQHLKEVEEPFEEKQIGSSAMAYKRNPMRSERIGALSRYIIINSLNPSITASEQWLERTLDDSANKRITIPEAFLATDAILTLCINISSGLVVYEKVIAQHIEKELPFMATENIIMEGVKKGGDRQELHERIRIHSMEAAKQVKVYGKKNDLLNRIAADKVFALSIDELNKVLNPKNFIGRAPNQVEEFICDDVQPILESNKEILGMKAEIHV